MEDLTKAETPKYLACERRGVYELLMAAAGMMGAYTFVLRGGVFCNAQTANLVMMAVAFGQGNWRHALYFLIPVSAYFGGALLSELLPRPVRKIGLLRWDTYLIGLEALVLLTVGFIPLTVPHQVVQVAINFICSMQYNTFRQAQGIPMATTFCTNHVRMLGVNTAKYIQKKDAEFLERLRAHGAMLLCFIAGGALISAVSAPFQEKAIWLALIPLTLNFLRLVRADLVEERGQLGRKPSGH